MKTLSPYSKGPLLPSVAPLNFTCNHFVPLCATILDRFKNLSRENSAVKENYCGNERALWRVLEKPLQVVCAAKIVTTLRETVPNKFAPLYRNSYEALPRALRRRSCPRPGPSIG